MNLCNVNAIMLSLVVIALFKNGHILCDNEDKIPNEYKGLAKVALDQYNQDCGTLKGQRTRFSRLIGGRRAWEDSQPWMAYIKISLDDDILDEKNGFCAGTLIGPCHVLTAAHCFEDISKEALADKVTVYLGNSDIQILEYDEERRYKKKVLEIKIHKNFKKGMNEKNDNLEIKNDIAIVILEEQIVVDDHVWPICLTPKSNRDFKEHDNNTIMAGWGNRFPEIELNENGKWELIETQRVIQNLRVYPESRILTNEECGIIYEENVPDESICVGMGYHSFCKGDSGGPVIVREPDGKYYQIAVISSSSYCRSKNNYPGYGTRVNYFRDWIDKIVINTYAKIFFKKLKDLRNQIINDNATRRLTNV